MNRKTTMYAAQRGATALFLVIFSTVLLTVITVSFSAMMINEQERSLDNVLSQAAYDSATNGVEDAKRVIVSCQKGVSEACSAIAASKCDTTVAARVAMQDSSDGSVSIQSTSAGTGKELVQAYTCVKINMNSQNFIAPVSTGSSVLVPLKAAGPVDKIAIEWYKSNDHGPMTGSFPTSGGGCYAMTSVPLCPSSEWNDTYPPILRAQFILPSASFSLQDLDNTGQTLFLRPFGDTGALPPSGISSLATPRYTGAAPSGGGLNAPVISSCSSLTEYACRTEIQGVNISQDSSVSFLRLNTIYRDATVRVTMYHDDAVVPFSGVQPTVDSTGRANDVYRRVLSRLSLTQLQFPLTNALELGNSLCKDYSLTESGVSPGECTP